MGRMSTKDAMKLKGYDFNVILQSLKGMKTLSEAREAILKATNKMFEVQDVTLIKMVETEGGTPQDYPFLQKTGTGKKGKTSTKDKMIASGFNVNDILSGLKTCKSIDDAVEDFKNATNGEIEVGGPTIIKMIETEGLNTADFQFLQRRTGEQSHRGKKSTAEKMQDDGFDVKSILNGLKGIQTIDEAIKAVGASTNQKYAPGKVTLIGMLEAEGLDLKDFPFTQKKEAGTIHHRKPSTKDKMAEAGIDFRNVMDLLKGLKTVDEAVKVVAKETKGQITPSAVTIIKMIENEGGDPNEFPFMKKSESGKKGIESFRSKLEKVIGMTVFEAIRLHCKGFSVEAAVWKLKELSGNTVDFSPKNLSDMISKGIDAGEVTEADQFYGWCGRKRKRKEATETSIPTKTMKEHVFRSECSKCGNKSAYKLSEADICSENVDLGIRGKRCTCGEFGTLIISTTIDGVSFRKAIVEYPYHGKNMNIECFVDENMSPIGNPLPVEVQKRFKTYGDHLLANAKKRRDEQEHSTHGKKKHEDEESTVMAE